MKLTPLFSFLFLALFLLSCGVDVADETVKGQAGTTDASSTPVSPESPEDSPSSDASETATEPETDAPAEEPAQAETPPAESPGLVETNESGAAETENSSSTSTSTQQTYPDERCIDPDMDADHPDGLNYDVAVNISVNGKAIERGFDYCTNAAYVAEWYCQNGIARVKTYKCPNGCTAGICN